MTWLNNCQPLKTNKSNKIKEVNVTKKGLSDTIKRRFIRDFKLPVPVIEEPHFSHYLGLSNKTHKSFELLTLLSESLSEHGSEEAFFTFRDNVLKRMKSDIMATSAWKEFEQEKIVLNLDQGKDWQKDTLYQPDFAGFDYISLDMKKANFQALRFVNAELVLHANTYEELLSRYTDNEYLHRSKMFRQVFFGALLPKKQVRIQRYLMFRVYEALKDAGLDMKQVYSANNDELIVRVLNKDERNIAEKVQYLMTGDVDLSIEHFHLEQVHPVKSFFAKRYSDNTFTLKKVDGPLVPEVLRHMRGEKPSSCDRFFLHDGRVAQFNTPLYEVA